VISRLYINPQSLLKLKAPAHNSVHSSHTDQLRVESEDLAKYQTRGLLDACLTCI
jgi:hypothetical protein